MVSYLWEHLACDDAAAVRLADALAVDPVIGRLLILRGITDPDAAHHFLNPRLDCGHLVPQSVEVGLVRLPFLAELLQVRQRLVLVPSNRFELPRGTLGGGGEPENFGILLVVLG